MHEQLPWFNGILQVFSFFAVCASGCEHQNGGHDDPDDGCVGIGETQPPDLSHRGRQELHHEAETQGRVPSGSDEGGS